MKYTLHWDIDQRSEEWFHLRSNSIGGTSSYDLLRLGDKEQTLTHIAEVNERNRRYGNYTSPSAQWGVDNEPVARNLLEGVLRNEKIIQPEQEIAEVGLITCDIPNIHQSPDGILINRTDYGSPSAPVDAIIELKCFQMEHSWRLWEKGIDDRIVSQIQWGMFFTNAPLGWFACYCPMMEDASLTPDGVAHPERVLLVKKISRDYNYLDAFAKILDYKGDY